MKRKKKENTSLKTQPKYRKNDTSSDEELLPIQQFAFLRPKESKNSFLSNKNKKKTNNITKTNDKSKNKIDSDLKKTRNSLNSVIGSEENRKHSAPIKNKPELNDHEFFIGDKCLNCNFKYVSKPAKKNHINIFRKKSDIVHIPEHVFDANKHMVIVCEHIFCCESFINKTAYYNHIKEHNQIKMSTLPIYQDPSIKTLNELSCKICRGEFVNKSNLINHEKTCNGIQLFFCDICNFSNSKFSEIIEHGRINHQKIGDGDFQILEEFKEKENIQTKEKTPSAKTKQKNKNYIRNTAVIYKKISKCFANEYTSLKEALSSHNLKSVYNILKNEKTCKNEFAFSLCCPVIISKTTDDGTLISQRFFRTPKIRSGSNTKIISAIKSARNSLLLQAEHMEETGQYFTFLICHFVSEIF